MCNFAIWNYKIICSHYIKAKIFYCNEFPWKKSNYFFCNPWRTRFEDFSCPKNRSQIGGSNSFFFILNLLCKPCHSVNIKPQMKYRVQCVYDMVMVKLYGHIVASLTLGNVSIKTSVTNRYFHVVLKICINLVMIIWKKSLHETHTFRCSQVPENQWASRAMKVLD